MALERLWRIGLVPIVLGVLFVRILVDQRGVLDDDLEGDLKRGLLPNESLDEPHGAEEAHENLCVDALLQKYVGEFGVAQLLHFVLVSLAMAADALHIMVLIFADAKPSWKCKQEYLNSKCRAGESSVCSLEPGMWEWAGGKEVSTVSEWGLVCGEEYKIGLAGSIFFAGGILGAGVFGSLSDSFLGRKGVLRLTCFLCAISGVMTALSPNYWVYLVLRAVTGMGCGGFGLSSFVLATEPVGPSKRGVVGMSAFYFFSGGIMVLPVLAYISSSSWRLLYVLTSVPTLLYGLLVIPFVSESPRWYLVRGRVDEAMETFRRFAKRNGRILPKGVGVASEDGASNCTTEVLSLPDPEDGSNGDAGHVQGHKGGKASGTILDVLRHHATRKRMIMITIIWFSIATVYYGISLNVVNIGFNLYLSVFLNALAEMPAFGLTAYFLGKFGRRTMLIASMLLSGTCCVVGSLINLLPESSTTNLDLNTLNVSMGMKLSRGVFQNNPRGIGQLVCGALGIFGMAGTYNLVYVYAVELFPTVVRNAALGLGNQAGQIGAVMAPLVVVLAQVHPSLPFSVFAVAAIVGGCLAFQLPETLNRPMWETLEGMEKGELST